VAPVARCVVDLRNAGAVNVWALVEVPEGNANATYSVTLSSGTLIAMLLAFSVVYFLFNSILLAAHQALKLRKRLFALWMENYSWAGLTYVASAATAGLVQLALIQAGMAALVAAIVGSAFTFVTRPGDGGFIIMLTHLCKIFAQRYGGIKIKLCKIMLFNQMRRR